MEEEYDLLGYGVIKLNGKDGKIKFGDYKLELHEGPVYVEDIDKHPKNGRYIWVSVANPGTFIKPRTPMGTQAPPEVINKFQERYKSKRVPKQAPEPTP